MVGVGLAFDPADVVATGMHQTYGPCHVAATDSAGPQRYEYVCAEDFDDPYRFCEGAPSEYARGGRCAVAHGRIA